ncbi:MAG TPA: O-antigen ligase family protein [Candidatus Hydrogenedentes bacterium]|nr:O-antigen ligase family protein [Candidatus Hydrogenedentota bacterium]
MPLVLLSALLGGLLSRSNPAILNGMSEPAAKKVSGPAVFRREAVPVLLVSGVMAALIVFAGSFTGFLAYDAWIGLGAALGVIVIACLLFGPSRYMLTCFLVLLMLGHQFRSPFVLPFAGVEWHPRELLLLLLIAHGGIRLLSGKANLRPDNLHYFFFLYAAFFAFIACRGLWRQMPLEDLIAECRYPIFLATYFVMVICTGGWADLRYYCRLILLVSLAVAMASLAFFAYCFAAGHVMSVQNFLGEFVQRQIGPFLLQSVRANGHMFFEVAVVVLLSLLFCREVSWSRRFVYALLIAVFLAAIAITMMRTAYIALFLSLIVLFVLFLPKDLQFLAGIVGVVLGGALVLAAGLLALGNLSLPGMEASIKGRLIEVMGALQMFRQHPLLGAGMGSKFTGMGFVSKTTLFSVAQMDYQTVHNVWMYFLFKGGLAGMTLVSLGLGGIAARACRIVELIPCRKDQLLMRGLLAAYTGQLIASLAMPRLTYPIGAVFLSMIACAFVMAARETDRPKH